MSTQLVRLFTCASVLSLSGLTAMASIVACSSDPAAAPADDDDDKGDDDDTTTKKDAGSSSSSSGSTVDAGAKRPAWCTEDKIAGTYTFGKSSSKVTTAGKVCDNYVKANNENGGPLGDITYTKTGEGELTMTIAGNKDFKMLAYLADDRCQIAGAEQAFGQKTQDANGNQIDVAIGPTHVIDFEENGAVKDVTSVFIKSDPEGAPGTPCIFQATTTGQKK